MKLDLIDKYTKNRLFEYIIPHIGKTVNLNEDAAYYLINYTADEVLIDRVVLRFDLQLHTMKESEFYLECFSLLGDESEDIKIEVDKEYNIWFKNTLRSLIFPIYDEVITNVVYFMNESKRSPEERFDAEWEGDWTPYSRIELD